MKWRWQADVEKGTKKTNWNKDSVGGIISEGQNETPLGLGEPYFDSLSRY